MRMYFELPDYCAECENMDLELINSKFTYEGENLIEQNIRCIYDKQCSYLFKWHENRFAGDMAK